MILLILTSFLCCKQTDCQNPQISCLQSKACDALQRQLFADTQVIIIRNDASDQSLEIAGGLLVGHTGIPIFWPHRDLTQPHSLLYSRELYSFPSNASDRQRNRQAWSFYLYKQDCFNPFRIKGSCKPCLPFIRVWQKPSLLFRTERPGLINQ